jgi:hypothetical protein
VERDATQQGSLAAEAAAQVQAIVAAAERRADERAATAVQGLLERIDALSAALDELRRDVAALGGERSTDEAGARLVALNMALEGSPRDATARYLEEHFELPELDALLDDVYASAGR